MTVLPAPSVRLTTYGSFAVTSCNELTEMMVIASAPLLSMRVVSGLPQQESVILICSGVVAALMVGEPAGVAVPEAIALGEASGVVTSVGASVGVSEGAAVGVSEGSTVGSTVGVSFGGSVASGDGVPSLTLLESSAYALPAPNPEPTIGATSMATTEAIVNQTNRRRNTAVPMPSFPLRFCSHEPCAGLPSIHSYPRLPRGIALAIRE